MKAPNARKASSVTRSFELKVVILFKIAQKVSIYLGYIDEKIIAKDF